MNRYLFPKKIVEEKGVIFAVNLLKKKPLQIGTNENSLTRFNAGSHIILDFGTEVCGGVRILGYSADNARVRIRFGESLTESCAEIGDRSNATNDHSTRDFVVDLRDLSDMTFGGSGFRFVRLDFYTEGDVKAIVAENRILRKRASYLYRGKDKTIKRIFDVAKRTIDLCASGDYLWDGIKRDRLVWVGDMHPEMLALTTLYGRMNIIERSLNFVKEQTPFPEWMNRIPMYSMWWIIIIADYSEYAKGSDFVKEQMGYLKGLVDLMLKFVDDNGDTHYPFNFVDWQTKDKSDELQGVRALNIIAAKKAINLLNAYNQNTDNAEELLSRLMKQEITVENSKSVLGLKYFATGLTENDKENLIKDGASGLSTFTSYYILSAVASFDKEKAVKMLKEYYGSMLEKGATTFWEDFDVSWAKNSCGIDEYPKNGEKNVHCDFGTQCYAGFRLSLCHGWSSGIIKFIKEFC